MALVLANRVQESATANTTVSFTLTGAVLGFQSFAVIGDTNTTFYSATDTAGNWEVGLGTYSTTGPTLTRTTIYASSNGGSAETFVDPVTVFVTYPSGKSVNLDASGNVSALGTVSSGTWQGTTVGVAYGGTGVTASSGANSVMLRDANQNVAINSITQAISMVASAGGTTVLTVASPHFQILTGTATQTFQLPDATTLLTGSSWVFDNDSTQNLSVTDGASGPVDTVPPGGYATVFLEDNSTVAGVWSRYGMIPSEVDWGTNSLNLNSTIVSGGTWQGGTIQPAYGGTGLTTFVGANNALYSTGATTLTAGTLPSAAGGTGLTTFTGANNALYSTDASTLTAGTLPVAAGGTGATTLTGYVKGNGTSAFTASATIPNSDTTATSANTANTIVERDASGNFSAGTITATLNGNATNVTGTVAIVNGGTGQTTANAAFNALAPSQTSNAGKYLTTDGTNTSWGTISAGASLSNDTSTASNLYPLFAAATTGTPSTIYTSNAQYLFKPSTGELSVKAPRGSNGIVVNSQAITENYVISSTDNGLSAGPITVTTGSITVSSGAVWTIV